MPAVVSVRTKSVCPCCLLAIEPWHDGAVSTVVEYKHPLPVALTTTAPVEKNDHFSFQWANGMVSKMQTYNTTSTATTITIMDIDPREFPVRSREHDVPVLAA